MLRECFELEYVRVRFLEIEGLRIGDGMQIVVVTRHLARAALYYGPVLRAMDDGDVRMTLIGPSGTDAQIAERAGFEAREIALRPYGQGAAPFEWAVLAGDLFSLLELHASSSDSIDVLMSFEADLDGAVQKAARAVRARLIVTAADVLPAASLASRAKGVLAPLLAQVRARTREVLPDHAKAQAQQQRDALQQRLREFAELAQAEPTLQQLVDPLRTFGAPAMKTLANAAKELRGYATPPPAHYLLRHAPDDVQPPGGWTDFRFGTGIDVEQFLAHGAGRPPSALEGETMRVGVHSDPFGDSLIRQAIVHDAKVAIGTLRSEQVQWQAPDAETVRPGDSLNRAASRYLNGLDVAIVPGNDLYAAMQAAAAGCAVITEVDSLAAGTFRDGESGYGVPALDRVQIAQILERLMVTERRARMQDSAQRRALRVFDAGIFLRRLTRGMEENLQVEEGGQVAAPIERGMRRHI